jgi:hypothetical protein
VLFLWAIGPNRKGHQGVSEPYTAGNDRQMKESFSIREWVGISIGVCRVAALGLIPRYWGGLWLVVLLGLPVAYLFLPKRPFLSWPVVMVAATISSGAGSLDVRAES